jgi:ATP-binding cassette subfamily B protein
MTFLGGGGPVFGGGQGAAAASGLPFGGIPSEMQEGVDRLLASEPDHGAPSVRFAQRRGSAEGAPLTLWRLLTRYPRLLLLAGVSIVTTGVMLQAGPFLTGVAINDGMRPGHHDIYVVGLAAGVYLVSVAVSALAQRAQVRVTGRLAAGVMNDLRVRVFAHLQRLSLDFFTEEKAGVLMSRMTSDIENLQQLLQDGLAQLLLQGLTMVVITVLLFVLNAWLALITVLLVVPVLTVASLWFRAASERGYESVRDGIANVLADLSESLHGIRVMVSFNRQERNKEGHRRILGDYRDANLYTGRLAALYGPGTQMLGVLGQGALLAIGGEMVLRHSLSIGALVAFFLYLNRFLQPIQLLVQQYNTYQQGHASIGKLRRLLATEPSVDDREGATALPPVQGAISFDGVSFAYTEGVAVLNDVDLTISPGETVALVGPTGAGKSTIAKLVSRMYDPTKGRVLVDGHDLREVALASLRRQVGVVPQEPFLFAGTLAENIAFARPEATDDEVSEAIEVAGLTDAVARMAEGADTVVQERGQALSSGERQLIALARAFLAKPRVLVLDEATSNLDLLSETKVESALDILLQGRTAVLVAHRLSTAMRADRIVVVEGGRIAETGSHEQLVAAGGLYASMYETWVSKAEPAGGPLETRARSGAA